MHRDHKLGLALGVLVVGFAGALCFPRNPELDQRLLQLQNASELDAEIAQLPLRSYIEAEAVPAQPAPPEPDAAALPAVESTSDQLVPGGDLSFALRAGPPDPIPHALPESAPTIAEPPPKHATAAPAPNTATPAPDTAAPDTNTPDTAVSVAAPARPNPAAASPNAEAITQQPTADTITASPVALTETSVPAEPAAPAAQPAGLLQYTVQPGDTLSRIAANLLGNESRYIEIFDANRAQLVSPDELKPGMILTIPNATSDVATSGAASGDQPLKNPTGPPAVVENSPPTDPASPENSDDPEEEASPRLFRPAGAQPFIPARVLSESDGHLPTLDTTQKQPAAIAPTYVVQRGDTLEKIAVRIYGDRRAVSRIVAANADRIANPHRLQPGLILTLPAAD